jgi:hypothetical protein
VKKIYVAALLVIMVSFGAVLAGCVRVDIGADSGSAVTKTYDFTGFTTVEVEHAFKADIVQSDNYSISIVINEKIADRLIVSQSGDTLKIGLKQPVFNLHSTPKVTITMPDLRGLELSGASDGEVRGFQSSDDFRLGLSGASSLDLDMETGDFSAEISGASHLSGYLKTASSDIEMSGASRVTLTGSGSDIRLDFSGASNGNLENYTVGDADIELSGASQVGLDIYGRLDADLSGALRLSYSGQPTMGRLKKSGGSSLSPK